MATPLPLQLPAEVNLDSLQFKVFAELEQAARPFNVESFRKCLHKDFRHIYLPRSLSEPERNKEEWVEHFAALLGSITIVDLVIHSITEAPGKLVLHGTASLESSSASMTTEEVATLHMAPDEDGNLKLKQVDEFRDAVTHAKWTAMAGITK